MKAKDIKVGLEVAFHPHSTAASRWMSPYRGVVTEIVPKGTPTTYTKYGRVRTAVTDVQTYKVQPTSDSGSGPRLFAEQLVKSINVWRPWADHVAVAQAATAQLMAEAAAGKAAWVAYDSMLDAVRPVLASVGLRVPSPNEVASAVRSTGYEHALFTMVGTPYARKHNRPPRHLTVPVDLFERIVMAAAPVPADPA